MSLDFHPYSEIFPLLPDAELADLAADIKAFGLREPIWLYQGKILDGRNRWLACQRAKVDAQFRTFKGESKGALALVISANLRRRDLTFEQRAFAAARVATLQAGTNQHSTRNKESAEVGGSREPSSLNDAATRFAVSRETVKRAKKITEKGSAELRQAAEAGEVSLKKAAAVVDKPKSEQLAAAKAKSEPMSPPAKPMTVEPAPAFDGEDYEPEDDEAYKTNIENVMMADDKLAAMREELKAVYREMAALKASRDHYQSQAGAAVRLVNKLRGQLEKLRAKHK